MQGVVLEIHVNENRGPGSAHLARGLGSDVGFIRTLRTAGYHEFDGEYGWSSDAATKRLVPRNRDQGNDGFALIGLAFPDHADHDGTVAWLRNHLTRRFEIELFAGDGASLARGRTSVYLAFPAILRPEISREFRRLYRLGATLSHGRLV